MRYFMLGMTGGYGGRRWLIQKIYRLSSISSVQEERYWGSWRHGGVQTKGSESDRLLTEPASMRKAPSLLSFSTESWRIGGWGIVRSLMLSAPWEMKQKIKAFRFRFNCNWESQLTKKYLHNHSYLNIKKGEEEYLSLIETTPLWNLNKTNTTASELLLF